MTAETASRGASATPPTGAAGGTWPGRWQPPDPRTPLRIRGPSASAGRPPRGSRRSA